MVVARIPAAPARAVLAAMLAAAALAAAPAGAAEAAASWGEAGWGSRERAIPTSDFLGITAWTLPAREELETLGAGGVGTFRVNFYWPVIEPLPGERDWTVYDRLAADAARAGMRLLPVFVGSSSFAARSHLHPPLDSPRARRLWSGLLRDAAARYGHDGRFWREHPELPYRPVRGWQVWNEQNTRAYWRPRPSASRYVRLLKLSAAALRSGDPRALVVTGGLPDSASGTGSADFAEAIYRVPGAREAFDVMALHPYARTGAEAERLVGRMRSTMRRHGDGSKPIWITELGWATAGPSGRFTVSVSAQARRVSGALRTLARRRDRYGLGMIVWFSWRDRDPYPDEPDSWALHTGLFDAAGRPKPAWQELLALTGGDPCPIEPLCQLPPAALPLTPPPTSFDFPALRGG